MLNVRRDLVGKTITGVIAVPGNTGQGPGRGASSPAEIWMLQFSDGSHVEFVSPGARRGLRRSARRAASAASEKENRASQLSLNVA